MSSEAGNWWLSGTLRLRRIVFTGMGEDDLLGPEHIMTAGLAAPGSKSVGGVCDIRGQI